MPPAQSGYAPVENGELYYEVTGDGPAVVFIHAAVADHTMWEPQVEPFSRYHKVLTYDMRGFGASRNTGISFSSRQDILDLLSHLGIGQAVLVGNSRGGQIALNTAIEFPEIVSGVVWICGGVEGHDTAPTQAELEWFDRLEALWEAKDWETLTDLETTTWANGIGQPEDRAPADLRKKLHDMIYAINTRQATGPEPEVRPLTPPAAGRLIDLTIPILAIVGDLDTSGTKDDAAFLTSEAPNARKVVFHNVAHMVSMEKPEEFNRLVLDFLSENGL